MKIIKHDSVDDFLSMNEEFLLAKESIHNLILGLAYSLRDKKLEPSDPLYYSIESKGKIVASVLRSNYDKPLIITEMPAELIDLLIKDLTSKNIELAAVVGEEHTTTYFKNQWINLNALNFKINLHLGVYECFNVIFPKVLSGQLREATQADAATLKSFIAGFMLDCFPDQPIIDENVEKLMNRHLENKSLFLLVSAENEIVSMAANTRSTLNGGTISLVYTPHEYRGQGHASTIVSLLSERIMKNGKKFASLFTDLSNPTSNSIYQKIGYTKIGQNIHFDFSKK